MKSQYVVSCELLRDKIEDMNKYPFNLDVVKNMNELEFHENVTFIVWENGSGKSTLIEALAIAMRFNPEWWSRNLNFSTQATHSQLSNYLRIAKGVIMPRDGYFLRAESFYNVASNIDQLESELPGIQAGYWWKSLHEQSHWESFLSLFTHRLGWNGLYILDEPEAALSPQRQMSLLVRMDELIKQKSQFIIATHSPILLAYPNAKIIQISEKWFEQVSYKDTDHYNLYKTFLDNPEYMLKKLGI